MQKYTKQDLSFLELQNVNYQLAALGKPPIKNELNPSNAIKSHRPKDDLHRYSLNKRSQQAQGAIYNGQLYATQGSLVFSGNDGEVQSSNKLPGSNMSSLIDV